MHTIQSGHNRDRFEKIGAQKDLESWEKNKTIFDHRDRLISYIK